MTFMFIIIFIILILITVILTLHREGLSMWVRIEKFDNYAYIHFPIWTNEKTRNQVCERFKKDYEIKKEKPLKIKLGYRIAKVEYE